MRFSACFCFELTWMEGLSDDAVEEAVHRRLSATVADLSDRGNSQGTQAWQDWANEATAELNQTASAAMPGDVGQTLDQSPASSPDHQKEVR